MAVRNFCKVGKLTTDDFKRDTFDYLEPKGNKRQQDFGHNTYGPAVIRDKRGGLNIPAVRKKATRKRTVKGGFSSYLGSQKPHHYAHTADSKAVAKLDREMVCRANFTSRKPTFKVKARKGKGSRVITELQKSFGIVGRFIGNSDQKIMFCCTRQEYPVIMDSIRVTCYPTQVEVSSEY